MYTLDAVAVGRKGSTALVHQFFINREQIPAPRFPRAFGRAFFLSHTKGIE